MPLLISTTRKSLPKKGLNQTFRRKRRDFRARPWGATNQPTHPFSFQPKKKFSIFSSSVLRPQLVLLASFFERGFILRQHRLFPIRIYPSVGGGGAQSELKFGRRKGTKKIRGRDKAKFVMQTAPPLLPFLGEDRPFTFPEVFLLLPFSRRPPFSQSLLLSLSLLLCPPLPGLRVSLHVLI